MAPFLRVQVRKRVQCLLLVGGLGVEQFGPLERCEGVDTLPGSWGEITPSFQKTPVEVALRPQERQVRPRGSDMVGHPPGLPGTVIRRVLTETFDDTSGCPIHM